MSLPTLPKVEKLQAALHAKAKRSPEFRFYSLYDKVYRQDVLWQAYQQCRRNDGVPGVVSWSNDLIQPTRRRTKPHVMAMPILESSTGMTARM